MPTSSYLPPPPGRMARLLPLLFAAGTLCAGLVATAWVWNGLRTSHDAQLRAEFDYRVRELQLRIGRRMATYQQVLRGAQAYALATAPLPGAEDFRTYVGTLQLREHYPGIQGVGIALPPANSRPPGLVWHATQSPARARYSPRSMSRVVGFVAPAGGGPVVNNR